MKDLAEKLEELLTMDALVDIEVFKHTSCLIRDYYINNEGKLAFTERVNNSTYASADILFSIDATENGGHCNCDWCSEWERSESLRQEYSDNKSAFIKNCIDNNIEVIEELKYYVMTCVH